MKKLVMYSDQIPPLADQIDKELLSLIAKPNPVVGYIPSKADPERSYYKARQDYYSRLGMDLRVYFELDNEYQPNLLDLLLSCDAIHLSGGNTYYFLYWMRRRRLIVTFAPICGKRWGAGRCQRWLNVNEPGHIYLSSLG